MPIHFAAEPINGIALVQKGLGKVATRTSPLSGLGVDFNALELSPPHAVYDLRADAVAAGGGLASAKATGFRYLVRGGGANIAAGEVLADASGAASLLANINYGPFVEATAHALTEVAKLPAVSAGSFEVRLLRFSAIALLALWLKSDSGGADIVYPLSPAPPPLQAENPYSAADFIQAILPLARQRAERRGPSVP
ncbi:MAG: hypothetical protein ABSD43_13290 [Terracidiphilus sp.]|jgi:hypothetical protein